MPVHSGQITVNHREFNNYFPTEMLRMNVRRPLQLTENVEKFDILATVEGGGVHSQSGAVRLGIATLPESVDRRDVTSGTQAQFPRSGN